MIGELIFWGVWLLIPACVDGAGALISLVSILLPRRRPPAAQADRHEPPYISIIVPVYNSAATLAACLRSLSAQDYPRAFIEVLVVNNGSTDASELVYEQSRRSLGLNLTWHSIPNKGKFHALNSGIHLARGDYIFNVDSDTVLSPNAVRRVVEEMEARPRLAAVTGAIDVLPPAPGASPLQRALGGCEFLEYLTAFQIGRRAQTRLGNLYTLSGAFSVFRREVLLGTFLYRRNTVTEDTDLTFQLYERFRDRQIALVPDATAYVHPIESLRALYAQRTRWQRGQLEVSALFQGLLRRSIWAPAGFAPARVLLIDHTLAFPRLVWTALLPLLLLFGYSAGLLLLTTLALYLFYLLIDSLWLLTAMLAVGPETRRRIGATLWALPLLPLYRALIYWFRMSGFLHAVAEPGSWRVVDPLRQTREAWADLRLRLFARLGRHFPRKS